MDSGSEAGMTVEKGLDSRSGWRMTDERGWIPEYSGMTLGWELGEFFQGGVAEEELLDAVGAFEGYRDQVVLPRLRA